MLPFGRKRKTAASPVIVALSAALAGTFAYTTFAAPAAPEGMRVTQNDSPPAAAGAPAQSNDDPLIVTKNEEVVQDGTHEWGAEADQTFVSPRYVKRNFLEIKSRADNVLIKSISVDRGNCPAFAFGLPATMKFGEAAKILVMCDPIEAVIETDRGPLTFSWDQ